MKTIRVAAAVICDDMDNPSRIFATAKGYGEFKGQWEFPGGKIEAGEAAEEALVREIREELDTEIEVGALIHTIEYDYPAFHLSMDCFLAKVTAGSLTLKEAQAARWLTGSELYEVPWLPADISLIRILEKRMAGDVCQSRQKEILKNRGKDLTPTLRNSLPYPYTGKRNRKTFRAERQVHGNDDSKGSKRPDGSEYTHSAILR